MRLSRLLVCLSFVSMMALSACGGYEQETGDAELAGGGGLDALCFMWDRDQDGDVDDADFALFMEGYGTLWDFADFLSFSSAYNNCPRPPLLP